MSILSRETLRGILPGLKAACGVPSIRPARSQVTQSGCYSQTSATIETDTVRPTHYRMKNNDVKKQVTEAIHACLEKKAQDLSILELEQGSGAFTDYFVVCSGSNPRQIQAIADEVELRLKKAGLPPTHVEGYRQAEWVLLDYVDFVVHVFSEHARKFYDLERLWKSAKKLEPSALITPARKRAAPVARRKRA
jgi:ribosome-associated protein